jgi:AbrB family looped-hinge helix DNA binding protein
MPTKTQKETCCQVEAVTTVDERGQMVLPKEIREKAQISAGDKLALITWKKEERVCCLTLIKVDELSQMVKDFLGPVMQI